MIMVAPVLSHPLGVLRHLLICRLWLPFCLMSTRVGLWYKPEASPVWPTWNGVLRRLPDGMAFVGPPFSRARLLAATKIVPLLFGVRNGFHQGYLCVESCVFYKRPY